MFLIILTLLSALSLSVVGAYFSIVGLAALFSAISIPIIILASAAELGKIVGVSFIYQTWETSGKLLKAWLMFLIFVAMLVTSAGVYGLLSKGFLDAQAPIDQNNLELAVVNEELTNIQERIDFIDEEIANYRNEIKDLQQQIDNYPDNYASKRIAAYKEQLPRRKEINTQINNLRNKKVGELQLIKEVNAQRAEVRSTGIEASGDIGPIKNVAKSLGISEDYAITIMMIFLIIILDPLAITLLVATNMLISTKLGKKGSITDLFNKDTATQPTIQPLMQYEMPTIKLAPPIEQPPKMIGPDVPATPDDGDEIIEYVTALNNTNVRGDIDKNVF